MAEINGSFDTPIKGPSIPFAIFFAISGVIHVAQSSKHKAWVYLWLLPIGCIIFTAGFICREYDAYHPGHTFTASQGLFYSAVPIITASLYTLLARLLATQPQLSPLQPANVYIYSLSFSMAVIISLTSQGASSFFNSDASPSSVRAGLALLKTSLILQIFLNICSIGILAVFLRRCSAASVSGNKRLQIVAAILYMLVTLTLIRNVFRTIQIFVPLDSPAWTSEALFWVLDATPMLIFTAVLNVFHPEKFFQVQECVEPGL